MKNKEYWVRFDGATKLKKWLKHEEEVEFKVRGIVSKHYKAYGKDCIAVQIFESELQSTG